IADAESSRIVTYVREIPWARHPERRSMTWTAVYTRCVRPDRAKRKSVAWRRSAGLPNIRRSSTTSVSAATTTASRTRLATASAFASAAHKTKRTGLRGRGGRSSMPGMIVRNRTPARLRMSMRRADDDANTRLRGAVVTGSEPEHPEHQGRGNATGDGNDGADPSKRGARSLGFRGQGMPVKQWRQLQNGEHDRRQQTQYQ